MSAPVIDDLDRLLFARLLHVLTGRKLCGWGGCDLVADCGPHCRSCWSLIHAQRLRSYGYQPVEYLAAQVVRLEMTREYLGRLSGADRRYCRSRGCGHMQMVHTDIGCNGLRGEHDTRCRCDGFADEPEVTQ